MKNTTQKANAKPQNNNEPNNVWYFDQFKKGADQWREAMSNNSMYNSWQNSQVNAAQQMNNAVNSAMKSASNLMEHSSDYCSSYMSKFQQALSQSMEQASNMNSLVTESSSEAARMASESLNCRTPEDCRNWAQDCMNSAAQLAQQCIVTSAQGAVDSFKAIAKPLSQNTMSLQEAYLRALCDLNPMAQWCNPKNSK